MQDNPAVSKRLALCAALLIALASNWWSTTNSGLHARTSPGPVTPKGPEPLSVLTYNVHGLPWPIVSDRTPALLAIGDRLAALRQEGKQPSVVVLQEAFTNEAKQIGKRAGYRFVIEGPSRDLDSGVLPDARDQTFAAASHWLKGEQLGKFYDSGLVLLSDLPVLAVRRVAFPNFACAGYDCLANKGVLMVTVRDELTGHSVQIVTSHLNSRHSSYVPDTRSLYAFGRQIGALTRFIQRNRDPESPLVVAGDLNASSNDRRAILRQAAVSWDRSQLGPIDDVLHHCLSTMRPCGGRVPRDAAVAMSYGRDWQFYGSGSKWQLQAISLSVPFGRDANGQMLSDHIGYTAVYRLD